MTPDAVISPCHCAMMRKATRNVTQAYETALAPTGLKITQYSMLSAINRAEEATIGELAEVLVMDRSTLGHNLRPLERDGLLKIEVAKDDARSRLIRLTSKGRELLDEAREHWRKMQSRFEEAFGMKETELLRGALLTLATMSFPNL